MKKLEISNREMNAFYAEVQRVKDCMNYPEIFKAGFYIGLANEYAKNLKEHKQLYPNRTKLMQEQESVLLKLIFELNQKALQI